MQKYGRDLYVSDFNQKELSIYLPPSVRIIRPVKMLLLYSVDPVKGGTTAFLRHTGN